MVKIFTIIYRSWVSLPRKDKVILSLLLLAFLIFVQPVYKSLKSAYDSQEYLEYVKQKHDALEVRVKEERLKNDPDKGMFYREKHYRVVEQKTKKGEGVVDLRGLSQPEYPDTLFTEGAAYFQVIK